MSTNVGLHYPAGDTREAVVTEHTGATIAIGPDGKIIGETRAETSITGNYARTLRDRFDGFYWHDLNGMTGRESTPILARMVAELGTDVPEGTSYWDGSCPGIVGRACARFLLWAMLHPEAEWESWPGR
jgi:hypothetical protein